MGSNYLWSFRRKFHPNSLIEVGNEADLVVLNMNSPHLMPVHSIISNIVYSANGSDVVSLIIQGNLLMKNRIILSLDEEEILNKVENKISELIE
jgi:5-methylthioadenosine/S-adenosylhomocysteine deaminase